MRYQISPSFSSLPLTLSDTPDSKFYAVVKCTRKEFFYFDFTAYIRSMQKFPPYFKKIKASLLPLLKYFPRTSTNSSNIAYSIINYQKKRYLAVLEYADCIPWRSLRSHQREYLLSGYSQNLVQTIPMYSFWFLNLSTLFDINSNRKFFSCFDSPVNWTNVYFLFSCKTGLCLNFVILV